MNKFIIDEEAAGLLDRWRLENADNIRRCLACDVWYFQRFELDYLLTESGMVGYCEVHRKFFEVKIYDMYGKVAALKLTEPRSDKEDFLMEMIPGKRINADDPAHYENMVGLLWQATLNAVSINALLLCGNLVEPAERIVSANSVGYSGGDRTFVLRPYKDSCYAVASGCHRSPDGVFPVRGHFRRYKSGKVVWIEGYFKGVE